MRELLQEIEIILSIFNARRIECISLGPCSDYQVVIWYIEIVSLVIVFAFEQLVADVKSLCTRLIVVYVWNGPHRFLNAIIFQRTDRR